VAKENPLEVNTPMPIMLAMTRATKEGKPSDWLLNSVLLPGVADGVADGMNGFFLGLFRIATRQRLGSTIGTIVLRSGRSCHK
jgi:hypothetical protein